jgi:dolichyl-phosphate beta-glucosyltransferase
MKVLNEVELSLILPVYNSSSWILGKIQEVCYHMKTKDFTWELIIVDDFSQDDTVVILREYIVIDKRIKLLTLGKNMGKGGAVLKGLQYASGKNRIFNDCDLAYPMTEVDKIYLELQGGADMVIANRRHADSICELKPKIFKQVYSRELFGRILNRFIRILGLTNFSDTQAGLKGMRSWLIPKFNQMEIFRFGFDIELLLIAKYNNAVIKSIPVKYQYFEEESTVRIFKDGLRILLDIFKVKWKQLCGHFDNQNLSDFKARQTLIKSYKGVISPGLLAFITARTILLPLNRYHKALPSAGTVVEIGCGHGIVTQYLALRNPERKIRGCDPDADRISIAQQAGKNLANLEYENEFFQKGTYDELDGIFVNGVLYLLKDQALVELLHAIRKSLKPGGVFILCDMPPSSGVDLIHWGHMVREKLLQSIGFIKEGQGIFLRSEGNWEGLLNEAGFSKLTYFKANVILHRVFNLHCQ